MPGTPTQAIAAFGTLLQMFDDSGANPITVSGITNISFSPKLNTADASTMVSPNGWMERIGLMKDLGNISVSIQWLPNDPTGKCQQLLADQKSGFLRKFNILEPGSPTRTITFYALVETISKPYDYKNILVATLSLAGSGEPIYS